MSALIATRCALFALAFAFAGPSEDALVALICAAPWFFAFRLHRPSRRARPSTRVAAALLAGATGAALYAAMRGAAPAAAFWIAPCAGLIGADDAGLSRAAGLDPTSARVKRAFDLALGVAAAPFAVLALIAVRVVTHADGPWLYRQVRCGRHGRMFLLTKVRTMSTDAEGDGRPRWSSDDDERVTAAGRRLRRLWLDEIPQLFDVLIGRMSLVGPRPERPEFIEGLALRLPRYARRLRFPPGLTGLAQVSGYAGDTSVRRRLACDLAYGRRWSILTDLRILFVTARQVLGARRPTVQGRRDAATKGPRGGSDARRLSQRDQRVLPADGGGGDRTRRSHP
ncbi:MAG TPA: sugar transferase [Planctomycetota bacterium]|nr:sugar transferase [Planctomycetota bacterium]